MQQRVCVSPGNRKLGQIMNVSLTPILCCPKRVPCARDGCYALKAYRLYPGTRKAWTRNARIARTDPKSYFSQIATIIADNRPRHFRWHVAGDILSVNYLHQMCKIAEHNPQSQFLAFSKAFDVVNRYEKGRELPHNLVIIFSAWPEMRMPNPHRHPIAWMQDGREHRVPENAIRCPGNCESCGMCFELPRLKSDVVFGKH